jgi:probable HAF family extracellular repeat protein
VPVALLFVFKAFIAQNGRVAALPLISGDNASLGAGINDIGEAVGTSGFCATARHSVLWKDGRVTDLGSLGGVDGNLPAYINNRGEVVGESDLAGDATHHGFVWRNGRMTDLGTFPGDVASTANAINTKNQIVGTSNDASGDERAVLWQDGTIVDLNALVPATSGLYLAEANGINDRGQITGTAVVIATGEPRAYLATPTGVNTGALSSATRIKMKVSLKRYPRW